MKLIALGSDPEVILTKDGIPHSSESVISEVITFEKGFKIHRDNILLEFNIPPAYTQEQWVSYNSIMIDRIKTLIRPKRLVELSTKIDAIFEKGIDTEFALQIGCSEDYSIYPHYKPPQKFYSGYRCAGGHVHLGFDSPVSEEYKIKLLSRLDLYLSIPALFKESNNSRRKMYGEAGTYRQSNDKTRLEYRTPSNWWLFDTLDMKWMYDRIHYVVENLDSLKYNVEDSFVIQTTINTRDLGFADQLFKDYDLEAIESNVYSPLSNA